MTALVPTRVLASSLAELFEPVDAAPIDTLVAEYGEQRLAIERVAGIFEDERTAAVLPYFIDGNEIGTRSADRMFKLPGAVAALNAAYWQRLLEATDVLDVMPAGRREEWTKQIDSRDVPEFTEAAIRSTLSEHLAARHRYFAERVDGIFAGLSPEHVTNSPAGFGGKLIIDYMVDSDGDPVCSKVPLLVDLRIVVARFMGRTDIGEGGHVVRDLTQKLVRFARHWHRGEWVSVDGGAIEIKLHKSGTCHIRLHEELVWRLNAVLASVNPGVIPESARTRPKRGAVKKARAIERMTRPLPFAVVRALGEFRFVDGSDRGGTEPGGVWSYGYGWHELDKHVRAEASQVLTSIGGVERDRNGGAFRFDYNATPAIGEVVASGCVPDQKAHQFYPTPPALAARVVEFASIGPDDRVLEPSAGQGAIAELLPRERTTCVEASALHCTVLRAKGLTVVHGDFLQLSRTTDALLRVGDPTRVVMNPPFDRGQWEAHVEHAAALLALGGRLVAILPASAPKRLELPGFTLTWSEPIDGAFAGTSISIVILIATRV